MLIDNNSSFINKPLKPYEVQTIRKTENALCINEPSKSHEFNTTRKKCNNELISEIKKEESYYDNLKEGNKLGKGGIKTAYSTSDPIVVRLEYQKNEWLCSCPDLKEQSMKNHKILEGKKFKNVNNILKVSNETSNIYAEKYDATYQHKVYNCPTNKASGIERLYHLKDGLNGLKELREVGLTCHNDIKADNIAFKNGRIVVADVDLATKDQPKLYDESGLPFTKYTDISYMHQVVTEDLQIDEIKLAGEREMEEYKKLKGFVPKKEFSHIKELVKAKEVIETNLNDLDGAHKGIEDVIIDGYKEKFEREMYRENLIIGGITTVSNIIRKGMEVNRSKKDGLKREIFVEGSKGAVGIAGKMLETSYVVEDNRANILENFENFDKKFQASSFHKLAINFGVETGKEVANLINRRFDKPLTTDDYIDSGIKVGTNFLEFATNHGVNSLIEMGCEKYGIEVAKRATNYAANTVASTVGKEVVMHSAKEASKETAKSIGSTALKEAVITGTKEVSEEVVMNTLKSAVINNVDDVAISMVSNSTKSAIIETAKSSGKVFVDSLKSNALFGAGGFVVATAFDVVARKKPLGEAVKQNAKSSIGSAIGSSIGAALGSVVPVVGTTIGGVVGGILGGLLGSWF